MITHQVRISHLVAPAVAGLVIAFGFACKTGTPTANENLPGTSTPTPLVEQGKTPEIPGDSLRENDPALTSDEAWILSTQNIVTLTRKGTNAPQAIKGNVGFRIGDLLQVGSQSVATVLCKRRMCDLGPNTYTSCCTVPCQNQITLGHRDEREMPLISRNELSAEDAATLAGAEKAVRNLNLGPVTTQFLITTLYTNWKIKEANQELDRLSSQLTEPAAKAELQGLYAPAVNRTGNMYFKYNRIDDAKKLYLLNLSRSSISDDSREKAVSHVGLAQTYQREGDKSKAISNFETAKEIYVKQGDSQAAASTERQISNTRASQGMEIRRTQPLIRRTP